VTAVPSNTDLPADPPAPTTPLWHPDRDARLARLEARVREDIETTAPRQGWAPDRGEDLDVLVVGGGQAGLGTAFALRRHGISRVLVVDDGDPDRIGCWDRYARMHTLRSPKHTKGIELDVPSLHVRRWYEAVYGEQAWQEIDLVPRLDWNDYLLWYRSVTDAPMAHRTRVTAVHRPTDPDGAFQVELSPVDDDGQTGSDTRTVTARRVVFSLGLDGGGGPQIPDFIAALPRDRWFHTEEEVDPEIYAGKRVAVLGGGASGFDNAAAALDRGAASADVFVRREEIPGHNPLRWMEFPGMQDHFADLSDAWRWEFGQYSGGLPQPPTQHTIWRCFSLDGFTLHTGEGWSDCRLVPRADGEPGEEILVTTTKGEHRADLVVAATGYRMDLGDRPELSEFVDDIALWEEHHAPSAGHPAGRSPYLGPGFEFTPRDADRAPWIGRLYHLSTGARASMGVAGNQLSGIHAGLTRLGWCVAREVTRENWPAFMADFRAFEYLEVTSIGPRGPGDAPMPPGPRHRPDPA